MNETKKIRSTKIAVLEWICGGGLLDVPPEQIDGGLRAEGLAMLRTLVSALVEEVEVMVPLDQRLVSAADLDSRAQVIDVSISNFSAHTIAPHDLPPWAMLVEQCDAAWLIAPEIDSALPRSLDYLRACGHKLLNCHGEFLRQCSDKRLTAECLSAAGIAHPPTRGLEQIDQAWLNTTATKQSASEAAYWIVKPATGAGGTGQRLVTQQQLWQLVHSARPGSSSRTLAFQCAGEIVQPWMEGRPASCSVIVDAHGKRHWLPLVSQDFVHPEAARQTQAHFDQTSPMDKSPPHYIGCTYPGNERYSELPVEAPRKLLEDTLDALGSGAFGPVGIDLLYQASTQSWTVIEVNARCTSSLVGLAQAYRGKLVLDIFQLMSQADQRQLADFSPLINPFQFRIPRDKDGPA
ncbi:MAG: ATP-grasp domain-containing protein [Pirellulaceae bacterium]|nr:ATP-grasp domain-containing protein [Pirellulaceae bacterium]